MRAVNGARERRSQGSASPIAIGPAVISVGRDNRFGHPNDDVGARLRSVVATGAVFVTASVGPIEIVSDGKRWFTSALATWPLD